MVRLERVLIVGDVIASENVYGEDAEGKRRLLYAEGDTIPEEEASGSRPARARPSPSQPIRPGPSTRTRAPSLPAALAIADLVTLEEARLYCLRDETDTSYDALWAVLIPGISEAASLWADRQFTPQDDVTRDFPAAGWAGRTILSPWELREARTVSLDGGEVDFGLYPIGGTSQGTY